MILSSDYEKNDKEGCRNSTSIIMFILFIISIGFIINQWFTDSWISMFFTVILSAVFFISIGIINNTFNSNIAKNKFVYVPKKETLQEPNPTHRLTYKDKNGQISERNITMNLNQLNSKGLYINVYCHLRHEDRTFKKENIIKLVDIMTSEIIINQ